MKKRRGARLGQHFLKGQWAAEALVAAAEVRREDTVVEIGPGTGALTRELLGSGAHIVAIEKDGALAHSLQETFAKEITKGALELRAQDVRDFDPSSILGDYIVAANIPYYITGEIVRKFLTAAHQPKHMALLMQKEVAERIARDPKESLLSLSVKAYGKPKIVANVSRGNFSPPPSVDSAILAITDISRHFFSEIDEERFFEMVRAGFSSKRKLLVRNLEKKFKIDATVAACKECNLAHTARAEELRLEEWKCLARLL